MYHNIVLLGVVISILFYEFTGLSPAGLVVSGYFALCLQSPLRIAYTFAVIFIVLGIYKLISRWLILYGRRRFALMILLSFIVDLIIGATGLLGASPGLIGCLVPGIVAKEFERQGVAKTALALGIVTAILAIVMLLFNVPVFPVKML